MPGISARRPGPAGAFLAHRRAHVSLIADGLHVGPEMCATLSRAAGARLVLVSDATAATDAPPGRYRLGERRIDWDGVRATSSGRLAGGTAPLWRGVVTLAAQGIPRRRALGAATVAPRRLLGLPESAFPGHLVALDPGLVPRLTLVDGLVAFADPTLPFDVPDVGRPFLA
jgi:N-acetylglucosamine-6-phosphate deacetylase